MPASVQWLLGLTFYRQTTVIHSVSQVKQIQVGSDSRKIVEKRKLKMKSTIEFEELFSLKIV